MFWLYNLNWKWYFYSNFSQNYFSWFFSTSKQKNQQCQIESDTIKHNNHVAKYDHNFTNLVENCLLASWQVPHLRTCHFIHLIEVGGSTIFFLILQNNKHTTCWHVPHCKSSSIVVWHATISCSSYASSKWSSHFLVEP